MNLFFYFANNNYMKKLIIIILFLLCLNKINALEEIKVNNGELIPNFNKDIKVYNYFTNDNEITINNKKYYLTDDKTKIMVTLSNNEKYEINVFKNYKKDSNKEVYLENLVIEGYDIEFNRDCYLYSVNIGEEDNLNISYELSNSDAYVSVEGNGNFNKSDNVITINVNNDKEYIIHVYKSMPVSKSEDTIKPKEMSYEKKEIVLLIIITISCIFVFIFYYSLFINKSYLHI